MKYTDNLGLRMPVGKEYFNISTWNANMRILDEAYALLTDSSGTHKIPASAVSFDNTGTGISSTNVQAALTELISSSVATECLFVEVDDDITVTVNAYSHVWIVLTFGETVYDVTFEPSITGSTIEFENDEPQFEPNSVYELSFLQLNCRWFKR